MEYPSKVVEEAVGQFSKLPGIGRKTALRLVLHLLRLPEDEVKKFGDSLLKLKTDLKYCRDCHNIADAELCAICSNERRSSEVVCVVEDLRDVMAIENTSQYRGRYHVLGGLISPVEGVGPEDLQIHSLLERVEREGVNELVFALAATMEGDTTAFFISRKLQDRQIKITTIARGISVGGELEYADEITLGRSILGRIPYKV